MRCPSPSAACDVSADLAGWRGPSLADVQSAVFSVEGGRTIAIGRLTHGAAPSRLEGRAQPDPRRGVGDLRGVLVLRLDAAPLLGLPGH
jgi:hypothetical protein